MATLRIRKGATERIMLRWATSGYDYVNGITFGSTAPLRITAPAHGLPDGWSVAVQNATGGASVLNARSSPPASTDYRLVRVIDGNTLEMNAVNPTGWRPSTPAVLIFKEPLGLTGCNARAQIRKTANAVDPPTVAIDSQLLGGIVVNPTLAATVLTFLPTVTEPLATGDYVMDVELIMPDGTIIATQVIDVEILPEVTRG